MRWPIMLALFLPFFVFVALVLLLYNHMETTQIDDATLIPNALDQKNAPIITLPSLLDNGTFKTTDFKGRVTLINFWGSWCPPCREEHPILMEIAKDQRFDLVGVNYKDQFDNAMRFLNNFGNPFKMIGVDSSGRAAIDFGVYGPPETFILNKNGQIIHKHIGPMDRKIYQTEILPKIEKALTQK